ncbi:flagellar protein FlaG [Tissierella praeacuta]|uniref:flagellar protein FlaG n=1 Tax=Tissierella praeacuta TaxID=43131 RepID=UPI00334093FE
MQLSTMTNVSVNPGISQAQVSTSTSGNGEMRIPRQMKQNEQPIYREDKRFSEEDAIDLIEKANKDFVAYDRRFEFSIHEKTKEIMVKVIDVTTEEVIRELPPEKILDMVAAMWEVAGIIVDRKI